MSIKLEAFSNRSQIAGQYNISDQLWAPTCLEKALRGNLSYMLKYVIRRYYPQAFRQLSNAFY